MDPWLVHREGRDGSSSCSETACTYFMKAGHCARGHFKSCGNINCSRFMKVVEPTHVCGGGQQQQSAVGASPSGAGAAASVGIGFPSPFPGLGGGDPGWAVHHEGRDGSGSCHETSCKYFMKSGHCARGHFVSCREIGCIEFMKTVNPGHVHQK